MRYRAMLLLAIAIVLAPASRRATAAQVDYFLKIDGADGEAKDTDHEGWIVLQSFSWGSSVEIDAASGLPTGKRRHKPFTLVKQIDKASPRLLEIFSSGTQPAGATLHVMMAGDEPDSEPVHFYTIAMTEILIASIENTGSCDVETSGTGEGPFEVVTLNYGTIETTHEPTGTGSATDPAAAEIRELEESSFSLTSHKISSLYDIPAGQVLEGFVYSSDGRRVSEVALRGPQSIRTFDLPSGVYVLKVRLGEPDDAPELFHHPVIVP